MQRYDVAMSREAHIDNQRIYRYIRRDFGKKSATAYRKHIGKSLTALKRQPHMWREIEYDYRGYYLRKGIMSPSVYFYTVRDDIRSVVVLRIFRENQDWETELAETDVYHDIDGSEVFESTI